ncbi:hypothetical protein [Microcoleus sp. bin38.metabat.b11b12b14.051]|uniref:hypothetical protein n=1 Tax=Microcoleus sp. bin38.metabat.b11b12b14.051 TaxID=2742709 RepID=UPI0025D7A3D7|nr:hypothetical protein [Microcoleus sp. bin38.metabat.b11b12b14.051]
MTPVLFGRWQTRIFLLATVGVLVSLPFFLGYLGTKESPIYFWVLFYVGFFGLGWDVLYNFLQKFMWDGDWPGVFQFFAGIVEAVFLGFIIKIFGLPYIDKEVFDIPTFIQHYSLVWVSVYVSSWVMMRLLFPRWRFRGGQWVGKWPKSSH